MAVVWVQIAKTAGRAVGRTEPDVQLIKQVEQVSVPNRVSTVSAAAIPGVARSAALNYDLAVRPSGSSYSCEISRLV
jgi:hypothetical protein